MPALFTYLFKVNIALVLFCLGYYLVLRHLTFYTLNRIYLVAAILFSSVYPLINLNNFVQRHQQLAAPVQNVILRWSTPAENFVKPLASPDYWQWAEVVFWIGVIFLAIRLVMQLFSLYRLYHSSEPGNVHNYPVRLISGDVSPFSFWRSIYVNPDKLSAADLQKVLEHEHVHVSEWHTLDILLAELSTIFYWFNPGIWLMKKAVRENIEFITDQKILQRGVDSKQYQYSLLSVSMNGTPNSLVNNFNISTIKKRIIMMNAKRSSRFNLTRYMFVAPAVILLLLVFSISKAEITGHGLLKIRSFADVLTTTNIIHPIAVAKVPSRAVLNKVKPDTEQVKTVKLHELPSLITSKLNTADTVYAGKSKDGKRNILLTSDKSLDSIGYVINGVRTSRADLMALDPGHIVSEDIVSAKDASKFISDVSNKSDFLFITTDDSEAGKKLKEKLDKEMGWGVFTPNRARKTTASGEDTTPGTSYSYSTKTTTSDDVAPSVSPGVVIIGTGSSDAAPKVAVATKMKAINISKDNMVYVTGYVDKVRLKYRDSLTTPELVKTINIVPADAITRVYAYTVKEQKPKLYVTKFNTNGDELTIDGPGTTLFIVDGKEVKGIKNLSPKDIMSLTVLKGETAEKKYGEKAKNGVVVITTKKGK